MKIDLLNLLKSCKIFSSLEDSVLNNLLKKSTKLKLDQDEILFQQGELSNHVYLLIYGKIAIYLATKNKSVLVNEILPGTLIGELAALSHEPRSTTAQAVTKSLLLQFSSEDFIAICKDYNSVSLEIINTTFGESRNMIKTMSKKGSPKKHIAIVSANENLSIQILWDSLSKIKTNHNNLAFICESDEIEAKEISELKQYINKIDSENGIIIYLIKSYSSKLAELCFGLERLDMIYVVAFASDQLLINSDTKTRVDNNRYKIKPELVLLYKKHETPKHTSKWLKLISVNLHHHIRIDEESDWRRLLRFMTGNAIGIVLGGGGVRCWAQLGALMALNKLGIPIDAIGGSSAGSIVAGYYAMKQSLDHIQSLKELSEITNKSISITNLTWPLVSLFDAKDYTNQLKKIFRNHRIENLWLPCFCISTNLSKSQQIILKKGYLWKVIRCSTSIPIIFPPTVVKGELYLDGGLLNNLPVDIMKDLISNNKVIAVELTHHNEDNGRYAFPPILSIWSILLNKIGIVSEDYVFPHFIDTCLKSLLVGASVKQQENAQLADILITPDLAKYNLITINKNDEKKLIKIGYKETIKKVKK